MRTARVLQVPSMKGPDLNTEIPYIPGSVIPIKGAWDVRNTGDALATAGIRVKLKKDRSFPRSDEDKLIISEDGEIKKGEEMTGIGGWSTTSPVMLRPMSWDSAVEVSEPAVTLRFEFNLMADELWNAHTDNWWVLEMKMMDLNSGEEAENSNTIPVIDSTYEVRNFFRLVN